jgi:hypothetical protein
MGMRIDARQVMIDYLKMKVDQEDWHAVRDACVDIEIIEKQLQVPRSSISVHLKRTRLRPPLTVGKTTG